MRFGAKIGGEVGGGSYVAHGNGGERIEMSERWQSEKLYFDGDSYFGELLEAIEGARKSVDVEAYIFEEGVLATRLVEGLGRAVARGVVVRVILDHWGSPGIGDGLLQRMRELGVRVHLYRGLPWRISALSSERQGWGAFFRGALRRLAGINRGFHRKVTIIDSREVWVGSMNVSDVHLREVHGEDAWVDLGARVSGVGVALFECAFERAFFRRNKPRVRALERAGLANFNDSFWQRRRMNAGLRRRLKQASERIWLQTPYFLPDRSLLLILCERARRGVDVRLMIPRKSDLAAIRWMNEGMMRRLLKRGVKVVEYQPGFSHKKVLIVDAEHWIGSFNLNHRSLLHDLEVEVRLFSDESKAALETAFLWEEKESMPLRLEYFAQRRLWARVVSWLLFFFRYWC